MPCRQCKHPGLPGSLRSPLKAVRTKYKQTVAYQMASLDFTHIPSRRDHREQATIKTSGRPRRSAVPDLRFEQSYLRSIQSYIFPDPPTLKAPLQPGHAFPGTGDAGHGQGTQLESEKSAFVGSRDRGKNVEAEPPYDMPLDIRWRGVAWVTARDQVRVRNYWC